MFLSSGFSCFPRVLLVLDLIGIIGGLEGKVESVCEESEDGILD